MRGHTHGRSARYVGEFAMLGLGDHAGKAPVSIKSENECIFYCFTQKAFVEVLRSRRALALTVAI